MLAHLQGPGDKRLGKAGAAYELDDDVNLWVFGEVGRIGCQGAALRQLGCTLGRKIAHQHLAQHNFAPAAAADHLRIFF